MQGVMTTTLLSAVLEAQTATFHSVTEHETVGV